MRQRFNLNFQQGWSHRWRGPHNFPATLTLLGTVLLGTVILMLARDSAATQQEIDRMQDELQKIQQKEAQLLEARQKSTHKIDPKIAEEINRKISQLNLPWRSLLDVLEETAGPKIALISLEPIADKKRIKLTAEAGNPEQMLAYISRLKENKALYGVQLNKHEVNQNDPHAPYRFQIEASWRFSNP